MFNYWHNLVKTWRFLTVNWQLSSCSVPTVCTRSAVDSVSLQLLYESQFVKEKGASHFKKFYWSQGLSKIWYTTSSTEWAIFPFIFWHKLNTQCLHIQVKTYCFALYRIRNCLRMKLKTSTIATQTCGLRKFSIPDKDFGRRIFTWYFLHILFACEYVIW